MNRRLLRLAPALVSALALVSLATPGCAAADDVSETRPVSGFDRIQLDGAFTATVTAGKSGARFAMTGQRDALDRVTTVVRGGTLVVGMREGDNVHSSPKLDIDVPVLRGFKFQGAGSATITGLTGADLDLAIPGAGSVTASGRAGNEQISLDGTGKIDASGVTAHDVTAENNGVGAIYLRGNGAMNLRVNGVGEIRYAGNPTHVESHVNGIGRIGPM